MTIKRMGALSFMGSFVLLFALMTGVPAPLDASSIEGQVIVRSARDNGNAIVYIDKIPGKRFTPPSTPVTLDQVNLTFIPHVLPILAGTTVAFPNSDEIRHNVFSPSPNKFDLGTYPRKMTKFQIFDKPGPVTLLCNVHAEMSAYVFVAETPYFYKTDKDGKFVLRNVPPGRYVLKVWHERAKPTSREIEVVENQTVIANFELKK